MSFLNKKKKLIEQNEEITGIIIKDEPKIIRKNNSLSLCIMNGLLLFAILIGCAGTFLSAFEIPVNMYIVCPASFLICMFYALLYYNKIIKVIGYIAILVGFVYTLVNYAIIIRSGFSAITNIVMYYIEGALDLPVEREYEEYYTNRYVSVTFCVIMLVVAMGLMYNIIISEVKGSLFIVLTTFPVAQLGLYFEEDVNLWYFALYIIALIVVFVFRGTRHYKLETKSKNGYIKKIKGINRSYNYVNDGQTSIRIMAMFSVFILLVVIILSIVIPQERFRMTTRLDVIKDDTEEFAKQVAIVGLYGMIFDGSTGGIGRGELGDTDSVKYDFRTDLVIRIPEFEGMGDFYYKAYTGTIYEENRWKTLEEAGRNSEDTTIDASYNGLTSWIYYNIVKNDLDVPQYMEKISNVAANSKYFYNGYYSMMPYDERIYKDISREDDPKGRFNVGEIFETMNVYWNPDTTYNEAVKMVNEYYERVSEEDTNFYVREKDYREYVYDTYLYVPQENSEVITKIIKEENIDKSEDVIEAIKQYFINNFEYTLMPGKTPKGKDFVNHFLTESKKGYCTYFATSAVLMIRELGIPARYVGGYFVDKTDVTGGTILNEEDYDKWIMSGKSDDGRVMEVEVNDSGAHAWVEIYIDGLGWIPVEVTPPSEEEIETEEEEETGALETLMTTIFSPQTAKNMRNAFAKTSLAVVVLVVTFVVLYLVAGVIVRKNRLKDFNNDEETRNKIFKMTTYLFKIFARLGYKRDERVTYAEYGESIVLAGIASEDEIKRIFTIYEKAKYSPSVILIEEKDEYKEAIYNIRNKQYMSLKWYKKLIFKYVFML